MHAESEPSELPGQEATRAGSRVEWWFELAATVLLLVGSMVTAWNALESSRWGSVQSSSYAQASSQRAQWTAAQGLASQYVLYDVILFENWVAATRAEDTALADFYARRFRSEFRPAFDAWLALDPTANPDAPGGPLLMPEYTNAELQRSRDLDARAAALLQEGEAANTWSTAYVTNGFYTALAVFLAGINSRFKYLGMRAAVLAIGLGLLAYALFTLVSLPVV